jgi:ankyrin repeat protein
MSSNDSSPSSSKDQLLINAALKNNLVAVRKLLDDGVDVNWKDEDGWTALMWAGGGWGHIEVVKLLLDNGAQVNIQDNNGWTALMVASFNGNSECARLLLEKGADMSIKSIMIGKTAKDYAVEKEHADIVQLLNEVCMLRTQDKYFKYHHMNLIKLFCYSQSTKPRSKTHHRHSN